MSASRNLYLEERRQQVLRRIREMGRVSVAQLSQEFGISEVTIRNDLQALASNNLIVRTHGGAISSISSSGELALASRRQQQVEEKKRIGEAGASMIANGDAIILDSSSTALAIAQRLKYHHNLTIVTNSLAIAQEMRQASGVTVVLTGGRMRAEIASLVGTTMSDLLRNFNIEKGFFGAHGITVENGLTDVNADEAAMKHWMSEMCRRIIAVLDATKWGRVGLVSYADISRIDTVITDRRAPANLVDEVRSENTTILLV